MRNLLQSTQPCPVPHSLESEADTALLLSLGCSVGAGDGRLAILWRRCSKLTWPKLQPLAALASRPRACSERTSTPPSTATQSGSVGTVWNRLRVPYWIASPLKAESSGVGSAVRRPEPQADHGAVQDYGAMLLENALAERYETWELDSRYCSV